MSDRYDEYLAGHIGAVRSAARWMVDNLPLFDGTSEAESFLTNVRFHDDSKRCVAEYGPYDQYFYGDGDKDAFDHAWLHHIRVNAHHWQHWLLVNDDGRIGDPGKVVPLEMPKIHALEMVADWWSFSWRKGDLGEVFRWYDEHKDHIILHERTREYVESVLDEIRERI